MSPDRDWRGGLAILCVLGVFAYAFVLLFLTRHPTDIPAWMVATATLVVGHYFGAKNEVVRRDTMRDARHDEADAPPRPAGE